tara:strand:+ start:838 stop:1221 length:384 start_codon:yes stop_codon:yes gene_type:complete
MAKFIKFNLQNSAAAQPLGPTEGILVNVEDIRSVSATGLSGANAKTVVVRLDGRNTSLGFSLLTLTVSTSLSALVNPTIVTGRANPLVAAVRSAMTANPGGVVATAQLGVDHTVPGAQMYFRTAVFS